MQSRGVLLLPRTAPGPGRRGREGSPAGKHTEPTTQEGPVGGAEGAVRRPEGFGRPRKGEGQGAPHLQLGGGPRPPPPFLCHPVPAWCGRAHGGNRPWAQRHRRDPGSGAPPARRPHALGRWAAGQARPPAALPASLRPSLGNSAIAVSRPSSGHLETPSRTAGSTVVRFEADGSPFCRPPLAEAQRPRQAGPRSWRKAANGLH